VVSISKRTNKLCALHRKVTSIFKKFKKVACHQFVAPLGYEAALGSRVEKNNKSSEGIKIG
jgi:hypothetical protein